VSLRLSTLSTCDFCAVTRAPRYGVLRHRDECSAILASQQGGMIQLGELLDNLRHLDKRAFLAVWARVRQYWTAEKWVRVTDDERNVKWLGLNLDPFAMAQFQMRAGKTRKRRRRRLQASWAASPNSTATSSSTRRRIR
jgi:hypothetical protein